MKIGPAQAQTPIASGYLERENEGVQPNIPLFRSQLVLGRV
jgi:hypothetical protein